MRKEDQGFEPLMYIEQRNDEVSRPIMQKTYSSLHNQISREDNLEHFEQKTPPKRKKRTFQRHMYMDPIAEVEDKEYVEKTETDHQDIGEHQSFSELSIIEKVQYCTSTSNYIPKIHCMIKTDERTIVGSIANFEEGIVHIRPLRSRTLVEIPIEDIISIRITGF